MYINMYTIIKLIIDKTSNFKNARKQLKIVNNSNFPFNQDYPNTTYLKTHKNRK